MINIDQYDRQSVKDHNAYWANINELPPLLFDHLQMVIEARNMLLRRASHEPVGFSMLPELFTLGQLQSLYEAIGGVKIDKRNFRRRVTDMEFIEKTDLIDKSTSKRGAYLYKFNSMAYNKSPKFKL